MKIFFITLFTLLLFNSILFQLPYLHRCENRAKLTVIEMHISDCNANIKERIVYFFITFFTGLFFNRLLFILAIVISFIIQIMEK